MKLVTVANKLVVTVNMVEVNEYCDIVSIGKFTVLL